MQKNRANFYLVLGIVVGLFLTACAGVVTGKIDVPVAGGPFSPAVDVFKAPVLELDLDQNIGARTDLSVRHVHVATVQETTFQVQEKAVQEVVAQTEHFCSRGAP